MTTPLHIKALAFAMAAHAGQVRKFGPAEPYINHVTRVATMVADTGTTDKVIAAAYLHDVVEDTDTYVADIAERFGDDVATMVEALTNVPKTPGLNRAMRHAMNVRRLAAADANVHTIKLADLIDNTGTIVENADPKFAKLYLKEKANLLAVLTKGDPALYKRAIKTWADATVKNNDRLFDEK